jgi:hypothetical protein
MQRLTAFVGAIAMVLALLTGPLYHLHDRDHHGNTVVLVHAHLPEVESSHHHPGISSIEDGPSHSSARQVDFFTFSSPPAGVDLAIELTTTSFVTVPEVSEGVSLLAAPQSHSPPPTRDSVPRSPPAA